MAVKLVEEYWGEVSESETGPAVAEDSQNYVFNPNNPGSSNNPFQF